MNANDDVIIIGAGFSGTAIAAGLVRAGFAGRITLVERSPTHGLGVAYNPPSELLLLNVPARNMGVWSDVPTDFHAWLTGAGRQADPGAFLPRKWYGEYLRARLEEAKVAAGGRLETVHDDAIQAVSGGEGWRVTLAGGGHRTAGTLILALGNLRPGPPPGVSANENGAWWCPDPWSPTAHRPCRDGERILVVGTGLTMVDVCISLSSSGARPKLTVLSRNGLLPCVHASPGLKAVAAVPPAAGSNLRQMVRHVRSEARRVMREGGDWRAAVDCLRSVTPALWAGLSAADHKRFVQKLRTHWDVHRHRVPAEVVARLVELQQRKALRIVTGRLKSVTGQGATAEVTWVPRGESRVETGTFDRVINCTGARTSIDASQLLKSMAEQQLVRAEQVGLGLQTDAEGRAMNAQGQAHDNLWVIGPLRRGTLWESTAVPELRIQAAEIVRRIMLGQQTKR